MYMAFISDHGNLILMPLQKHRCTNHKKTMLPIECVYVQPKYSNLPLLFIFIMLLEIDIVRSCLRQSEDCQKTDSSIQGAIEGYFEKKPKHYEIDESHKKDCSATEAGMEAAEAHI